MTSLFISDIHVEPARPDITEQLLAFLASEARQAEALYILGDLFETWIGDDDPDPEKHRVVHALHDLTRSVRNSKLPINFWANGMALA